MRIQALIGLAFLGLAALPAGAQPLFANPLDSAAGYRDARGATPDATLRYRYEITVTETGQAAVASETTLDVATDWALYHTGDVTLLHDFRLNRVFTLTGDTFTTTNGMASLVFRVMERQNRTYLGSVLSAVGAGDMMSDCGSDAELGLALPGKTSAGAIAFVERQGALVMTCAGKEFGSFTAGTGQAPATLWPTLFNTAPMHPALFRRMRESGAAPQAFEIVQRMADRETRSVYRLLAAEAVATPYPLSAPMRNTTAEAFENLIGPGGAELATGAVAGTAQGGPPTVQSWGEDMAALTQTDAAAAAMFLLPSLNMFPELQCPQQQHPVCKLASTLNTMKAREPAPMAVIEIGMAEQQGNADAAIKAMQTVMASRHRDHPAAAGSFALALMKFKQADIDKAEAAGLPTDIKALQAKALMALPYNVAYWTDAGDPPAQGYHWAEATLFYDVAHALPMPGGVARNGALVGKRNLFEAIRKDFPDAFLPR